jgi:hypothetical protein
MAGSGCRTPELPDDNPVVRRGRKPVIYLYPPSSLSDVTVQLSLASSWLFSAVYPPPATTINPKGYQSLTWTVAAEPDGTSLTRPLVQKCPIYTGKQREFCLNLALIG